MQNVEIGAVWEVRGHPRSPALLQFDRTHTISCLTLIETLTCVNLVPFSSYMSKVADFNLLHLHLTPRWVTLFEFRRDL